MALDAVAQVRSFRGAADRLGYVQSAVSQQIAFLERVLGVRLLERSRGPKPVRLTPSGAVLLDHARDLLSDLQTASADLEALAQGYAGVIRVGAFDEVAARLLPSVVREFARILPDVDISATESNTDDEQLERCAAGRLDVVFADLPLPAGGFAWRHVLTDPYLLVVPQRSRLGAQRRIERLDDLADLRLVRQRGSRQAARVESQLHARGISPSHVREADSTATVQALVGANVGCALLPRLAVDTEDPTIVAIDASRLVAPRALAIVWRADRKAVPHRDAWVAAATHVCGDRSNPGGGTVR